MASISNTMDNIVHPTCTILSMVIQIKRFITVSFVIAKRRFGSRYHSCHNSMSLCYCGATASQVLRAQSGFITFNIL